MANFTFSSSTGVTDLPLPPGMTPSQMDDYSMLERFHQWVREKAATGQALWALAWVSFLESAFLPFPVEAISIPVMLANLKRIWLVALIATLSSVAGGAVGYAIGASLFDTLGIWLLEMYGLMDNAVALQKDYQTWGWTWVMVGGITPLPYKVISIASGMASLSLGSFIAASVISRGIRFAFFAGCFSLFGERLQSFIEDHGSAVSASIFVLLALGFAVIFLM